MLEGNFAVLRAQTVLLVEDNSEDAVMLERTLRQVLGDIAIRHVITLGEGREQIDYGDVDLLVTDWWLPDGKGLELIIYVNGIGIPSVAVSASDDSDIKEQALAAGALGFIAKPVSAEHFEKTISTESDP